MTDRHVDEKLAWLCHVEYEGDVESLEAEVVELAREELERLLVLAVVEIMESRADAEREIARYVRRSDNAQRGRQTSISAPSVTPPALPDEAVKFPEQRVPGGS